MEDWWKGTSAMWVFFGDENISRTTLVPQPFQEVFLLAGYAIRQERLDSFLQRIGAVKAGFGLATRHPVKYNLKDPKLADYYNSRGEEDVLKAALPRSNDLRKQLLALLKEHAAKTFICVIGSWGFKTKRDYYCWTATNLFQRLGYIAGLDGAAHPDLLVCFDWPDNEVGKANSCAAASKLARHFRTWSSGAQFITHTSRSPTWSRAWRLISWRGV